MDAAGVAESNVKHVVCHVAESIDAIVYVCLREEAGRSRSVVCLDNVRKNTMGAV